MPQTEKFQTIEVLHVRLAVRRAEGLAVVHTHGTFDLLHIGAVRHLEQARQLGGVLVVTISPDADLLRGRDAAVVQPGLAGGGLGRLVVRRLRGRGQERSGPDAIQSICPDIYVPWEENDPGDVDYRKVREAEAAIVRAVGGRFVALTSTGVKTVRLNHHASPALTPEASEFLNSFRTRYSRDDVAAALEKARSTSVLFVGETIIDEYQYCESIGQVGQGARAGGALCLGREVCRRSAGHGQPVGRVLRSHRHAHAAGHQGFARGVHPRETQSRRSTPRSSTWPGPARSSNGGWSRSIPSRSCSKSISWTRRSRKRSTRPCMPGSRRSCRTTTRWSSPTTATAC